MKTMTCKQLGGACNKQFKANTFEEMAELSKQHGMEMFQKQDQDHLDAMNKIQDSNEKATDDMQAWFESKKLEFETLKDD